MSCLPAYQTVIQTCVVCSACLQWDRTRLMLYYRLHNGHTYRLGDRMHPHICSHYCSMCSACLQWDRARPIFHYRLHNGHSHQLGDWIEPLRICDDMQKRLCSQHCAVHHLLPVVYGYCGAATAQLIDRYVLKAGLM